MQEQLLVGLEALAAVTRLLQRARAQHPTHGMYEAAEFQWWWRSPRSTDSVGQLVWIGDDGMPTAAVMLTDWGEAVALDPLFLPDVTPQQREEVIERGLAHAAACGFTDLDVGIDTTDDLARALLTGHGFVEDPEAAFAVTESWLAADDRPAVSALPAGYRLTSRRETMDRPHHMIHPKRPDVEPRLTQTSLYRSDLDLVILDADKQPAAYGLFWFDPVSATGIVEPMRTNDGYQRQGLARHILTAGIEQLVAAGATRVKICFEPANAASRGLYLDVGFVPVRDSVILSRRAEGTTVAHLLGPVAQSVRAADS